MSFAMKEIFLDYDRDEEDKEREKNIESAIKEINTMKQLNN